MVLLVGWLDDLKIGSDGWLNGDTVGVGWMDGEMVGRCSLEYKQRVKFKIYYYCLHI